MKIVIDPGHGAPDGGAVGPRGTREADINLQVSVALAKELSVRGHMTNLTRSGYTRIIKNDRNADLAARPAMASRIEADCFVSLHCNAAANNSACGYEVWTSKGQNESDRLATALYNAWKRGFPGHKLRTDMSDGDPDKEADYAVLRNCKVPAVLIELAFISNPQEEEFLRTPANHRAMAVVIANGIEAWNFGRRG